MRWSERGGRRQVDCMRKTRRGELSAQRGLSPAHLGRALTHDAGGTVSPNSGRRLEQRWLRCRTRSWLCRTCVPTSDRKCPEKKEENRGISFSAPDGGVAVGRRGERGVVDIPGPRDLEGGPAGGRPRTRTSRRNYVATYAGSVPKALRPGRVLLVEALVEANARFFLMGGAGGRARRLRKAQAAARLEREIGALTAGAQSSTGASSRRSRLGRSVLRVEHRESPGLSSSRQGRQEKPKAAAASAGFDNAPVTKEERGG